jgi:o-succinylbenzoic acid (OSB) synthetase
VRIESVTLREIRLRLKAPFETSFGSVSERRILLVEAKSDGVSGWGECTAGEGPFYNSETTDTSWIILSQFVVPLLLGKDFDSPENISALLEPIRGHEMSKAAVEDAVWDIAAQQKGVSLAKLLGGILSEIPCGVSIGIRSRPHDLISAIEAELAAGYQRIKIKIKPGKDLEFIDAVRTRFPEIRLMVDANSAYRLDDAPHLKKFDQYGLMMIEQPLAWDDIYEHAKLQAMLATPVCLDECIHNLHQAKTAVELGACRILNIKLGRVGGHSEARRVEKHCRTRGIPVWCGGMLESGIGRAHNIAMSTLPGFVLPGDVSASQRYWAEDIIEPEVTVTPRGTIEVPAAPGIGYRVRRDRVDTLTVRAETFHAAGTIRTSGGR